MKYLKIVENENEYQSFCDGEEYVVPHVVLISNTSTVMYKKIQSPLLEGITLRELGLGGDDTTTLGVTVYNYLKKKCGNGTNGASYTLLNDENLYCTYDSAPNPSVTNEKTAKITYCYYDEINLPDGVNKSIKLLDDSGTDEMGWTYRYSLGETGEMVSESVI